MSDEMQALCFLAGANSVFYGEKLLTTGNPDVEHDQQLLARLGMRAQGPAMTTAAAAELIATPELPTELIATPEPPAELIATPELPAEATQPRGR